jgi:hypothetical protein
MKARIRGTATLALTLLTVSVVAFGGTPGAVATQGQAIIAGTGNTETSMTIVSNSNVNVPGCVGAVSHGLEACGATGLLGIGNYRGLYASGGSYGVYGEGGTRGVYGIGVTDGVQGYASGSASSVSGVFGQVSGSGSGVYGENDGSGAGVQGLSYASSGVKGLGGPYGVIGEGETGIYGYGNKVNGVFGETGVDTASGVYGQNNGTGYGVAGRATSGTGVLGDGTMGISGQGAITGVKGTSQGAGDGVDGEANNSCCSGVYGVNNGTGNGVAGRADTGTGVLAASTSGIALKVDGKAQFSRSGKAAVSSGQSSIVVQNVALTSKSLVLATPQKSVAGVFVQGAVPNVSAHTVTISLSNTVGASYPVAWMVVERP